MFTFAAHHVWIHDLICAHIRSVVSVPLLDVLLALIHLTQLLKMTSLVESEEKKHKHLVCGLWDWDGFKYNTCYLVTNVLHWTFKPHLVNHSLFFRITVYSVNWETGTVCLSLQCGMNNEPLSVFEMFWSSIIFFCAMAQIRQCLMCLCPQSN